MRHPITRRLFVFAWIATLTLIPAFISTTQNQPTFSVDEKGDLKKKAEQVKAEGGQ